VVGVSPNVSSLSLVRNLVQIQTNSTYERGRCAKWRDRHIFICHARGLISHVRHRDSCQTDSGGPLILKGDVATADVQIGVSSWGIGVLHRASMLDDFDSHPHDDGTLKQYQQTAHLLFSLVLPPAPVRVMAG